MKKLNWFDFAIIALVLALAGGAAWYYTRPKAEDGTIAKKTKIIVAVEVRDVTLEVAQTYQIGDKVTFGLTNVDKGVIQNIVIKPSEVIVEDKINGGWVLQTVVDNDDDPRDDGRYDAIVYIELEGTETKDVITSGTEEVSIGIPTVFHGHGIAGSGFVVGLEVVAEQEYEEEARGQ